MTQLLVHYTLLQVRAMHPLKLKNYIPEFSAFPEYEVELDLLYKEAGKSNVYTGKTVKTKNFFISYFLACV